jgi:hypothetical protein
MDILDGSGMGEFQRKRGKQERVRAGGRGGKED